VQFTSPLSVSIASVPQTTYTITSSDGINQGRVALISPTGNLGFGGPDGTTSIQGRVVAVPLPAAAWAGMSLLSSMGVFSALRRKAKA
jgi:S-adenosylmethionine synthetase